METNKRTVMHSRLIFTRPLVRSLQLMLCLALFAGCFSRVQGQMNEQEARDYFHSSRDTFQAKAALELCKIKHHRDGDFDSAQFFCEAALRISRDLEYDFGIYRSLGDLGVLANNQNQLEKALDYFEQSHEYAVKFKNKKFLAGNMKAQATIYMGMGNFETGIAKALEAVTVFEEMEVWHEVGMCYYLISAAFEEQNYLQTRMYYLRKALAAMSRAADKPVEPRIVVYNYASRIYVLESEGNRPMLDSAYQYATAGIALAEKSSMAPFAKLFQVCLAHYYLQTGDFESGIRAANEALSKPYFVNGKDKFLAYSALAQCNLGLKRNDAAIQCLDSARAAYPNPTAMNKKNLNDLAYKVWKASGDEAKALEALKQYQIFKDSADVKLKSGAVAELEKKYKSERQAAEIALLDQKQISDRLWLNVLIVMGAGLLLAVIAVAILYLIWANRTAIAQAEVEQRLNRSRMNPHFFFNVLSSLQAMSLQDDRRPEVGQYLGKYARIMRQSLESTYADLVPLEEEFQFLKQYLDLQKLRFPGKFDYTLSVEPGLDPSRFLLPSMLLQPFIENSIEHGFKNISWMGQLQVQVNIQGELFQITVSDNGQDSGEKKQDAYPSRATQIVKERLELLNLKYKSQSDFEIIRPKEGSGYVIKIWLPVISSRA